MMQCADILSIHGDVRMNGMEDKTEPERWLLIKRLIQNGSTAMHFVHRKGRDSEHNTQYYDCHIGARNTALAIDLYKDRLPTFAHDFLRIIHAQELCHCAQLPKRPRSPVADRIAEYHEGVLRRSFVEWLACQPLIGERMALAAAVYFGYDDDPHSTLQGGLSELYHQTLALSVLLMLGPTIGELHNAVEAQEGMFRIMGVTAEDRLLIGADGEVCTAPGREAHQV